MRAMRMTLLVAISMTGWLFTHLAHASDTCVARTTLVGWASLAADTYRAGPPAGAFNDRSERLEEPRAASQPVQGVSSIKPRESAGEWWALSDNGFGNKWNSADYRLALYRFAIEPRITSRRAHEVELRETIELHDPQRHFPYRIVREDFADRTLTGADIDPESLVVLPDGSFWIGDEFGPWLMHFSARGELLAPPVELPGELRSPQHPLVLAGKAVPTVGASRGLEALAQSGDGRSLLAMLEAPLAQDAAAGRFARVFKYDLERGTFAALDLRYPISPAATAIGELAHVAGDLYLVIERDDGSAEAAKFKRIFQVTIDSVVRDRRCVADLLDVRDPRNLAGFGSPYRMPYFTIEAVHAVDERTLLVVNDNNFPAKGARGPQTPDLTEWAWLRLPVPLRAGAER
jgi:glycerophosphoryl diester phosphodiesterase